MIRFIILFTTSFLSIIAIGQVPKKVILEHYTNTLCSICSSRNPGLYANLGLNKEVLHLAIHPSKPYSACVLNQHNTKEQDDRTKAYGIFGSTPRIVIQGAPVSSSANYANTGLFDSYKDKLTPASITMKQLKFGKDSIQISVTIKTEAEHSLGKLTLFVAVVEDTVFYDAPNGEKQHFDVFRKTVFNGNAPEFNLPSKVGDSVVFTASALSNSAWDFDHIYAMAIVQEVANKSVVQVETTTAVQNDLVSVGIPIHKAKSSFAIYPNPALHFLNISETGNYTLMDINGRMISKHFITSQIDVSGLKEGFYILRNAMGECRSFIK